MLNHEYQVQLPEFEGPLDLLLHLVKRHELKILELPVSFITDRYLEYLELMQALNLDLAGEYLLMAATLAHLKSRELLPQQKGETPDTDEGDPDAEDGPDPKEALVRRLLEYQRYRDAAEQLGNRPTLGREVFPRGIPMEPVNPSEMPLQEVGTFALISAFADIIKRSEGKISMDVAVDRISISDRINSIVDYLNLANAATRFREMILAINNAAFGTNASGLSRHQLVVTFLAVLEMTRLRMIKILQHEIDGEIYLSRTAELKVLETELAETYG